MSESSINPPVRQARRLGTLQQAALENDRSERTIRNWADARKFPLYKVNGRRGLWVDLDEVAAAFARTAKRYGNARIIELPAQPVVVDRREPVAKAADR